MIGLNGGLLGKPRSVYTNKGIWTPNEQRLSLFDPYWDSVSLLLHMNGANGSTTFTDSSSNALAVTANGNAQISTAQSKFNGASAVFDGTGDFLAVGGSSSRWTLGSSGNFTIEGWIYANGAQTVKAWILGTFADFNTAYQNRWGLVFTATTTLTWYDSLGNFGMSATNFPTLAWTHVAVCRSGSTITMYVNGVSAGTQTTNQAYTTDGALGFGLITNAAGFNGYLDEFRITTGVARYTANFTPPSAPFPDA